MLLMFSLLPLLSGCDNEDDVIGIFTGKTWKLSRLTNKGSNNSSVNGTWKADGASGSLSISVKVTGAAESDALAKAFISGLQNVYKYEGDANSLTLYFKDGPTTRVMGFTPQR